MVTNVLSKSAEIIGVTIAAVILAAAAYMCFAMYQTAYAAEGVRIEAQSLTEPSTATLDPLACPMLQRKAFAFNPKAACGLQEDSAFDVFEYVHGRNPQPNGAMNARQVERWIVIRAATIFARRNHYSAEDRQSETTAAIEGLAAYQHGETPAEEWSDSYGRLLWQR